MTYALVDLIVSTTREVFLTDFFFNEKQLNILKQRHICNNVFL